ncbi:hypothetical protein [Bacillus sp. S14(2024)]|uniref:hypothetical protein n=1 Tax=Bacillus sp. S14(2024) TaxID=3162884 RepID=UPI003D1FC7A4
MIGIIAIIVYLAIGIITSKSIVDENNKLINLYRNQKYKEIDDTLWESTKDQAKIIDHIGEKGYKIFFHCALVISLPIYLLYNWAIDKKNDLQYLILKHSSRTYKNGTKVLISNPQEKDYEWSYEGEWEKHKGKKGIIVDYFPPLLEVDEREAYVIKFEDEEEFEYEADEFTVIG